jgi:hypothetical protein
MQEIESVIDEVHVAFAVGGGLGVGESRQPSLVHAAEFPVEVSGVDVQVRERCNGAWIFVGPIEAGPSEQLDAVVVDARGHPIAVQLYFVQPLRPRRRLLDWLGKLRSDELRKGNVSARRTGLDGVAGRTLDDTRHRDPLRCTRLGSPIWPE